MKPLQRVNRVKLAVFLLCKYTVHIIPYRSLHHGYEWYERNERLFYTRQIRRFFYHKFYKGTGYVVDENEAVAEVKLS